MAIKPPPRAAAADNVTRSCLLTIPMTLPSPRTFFPKPENLSNYDEYALKPLETLKETTVVVRFSPKKCAKSLIQHCAFIALRGDTGFRLGEANLQFPRAGFPMMEIFCKLGIKHHQPTLKFPEDTNKDSNKLPWCTRNQRDTKP
jgi:hypothetical protein